MSSLDINLQLITPALWKCAPIKTGKMTFWRTRPILSTKKGIRFSKGHSMTSLMPLLGCPFPGRVSISPKSAAYGTIMPSSRSFIPLIWSWAHFLSGPSKCRPNSSSTERTLCDTIHLTTFDGWISLIRWLISLPQENRTEASSNQQKTSWGYFTVAKERTQLLLKCSVH